jgi:hypothetical protein
MRVFKFLRGYIDRLEPGIVWLPYIMQTTEPVVIETNMNPRRGISQRYYGAIDPATNHYQTFNIDHGREL